MNLEDTRRRISQYRYQIVLEWTGHEITISTAPNEQKGLSQSQCFSSVQYSTVHFRSRVRYMFLCLHSFLYFLCLRMFESSSAVSGELPRLNHHSA